MYIKLIWFVTFFLNGGGGSRGGEDAGTKPGGSTIISIGGLWPKIDQLDEVDPRNLSLPTAGN
jgi:hypothetical protein